jgi:hypothetical protein
MQLGSRRVTDPDGIGSCTQDVSQVLMCYALDVAPQTSLAPYSE